MIVQVEGGYMRKALATAFVIAASFVGCGGTPTPVAGTHTVVGEASYTVSAPHLVVPTTGPQGEPDGPSTPHPSGCHSTLCWPQ
jgi:hypothetical protein